MISLNKVMLVGNLTRDPDLRHTPNGKPVTSFGVATNRRWKNETGELQEETEFHTVVVWGKLAEVVPQILKKGHRVFIEGRLRTRSWEGQDGIKRQRTEVVMENFIPLTPKAAKEVEEITEAVSVPEEPVEEGEKDSLEEEIDLDEIPF